MPRYKFIIEYDGIKFCGWQKQKDALSIQEAIEEALYKITQEKTQIFGAGRTDAGVHAIGQVAHVDLQKNWPAYKLRNGLNARLKMEHHLITILEVEEVDDNFHARFDAKKRHYVYKIFNRRTPPSLFMNSVWWIPYKLDPKIMHEAAQSLVGKHDFTTFRASMCQAKSPIRSLDRLDVIQNNEMIEIYVSARSFLHNQIRSFAGSLKDVGSGRFCKKDLEFALAAKNRAYCGVVAPPYGLYFLGVDYEIDFSKKRYMNK